MLKHNKIIGKSRNNIPKALIDDKWVECDFCSPEIVDSKYYQHIGVCTKFTAIGENGKKLIIEKEYNVYKLKNLLPLG